MPEVIDRDLLHNGCFLLQIVNTDVFVFGTGQQHIVVT